MSYEPSRITRANTSFEYIELIKKFDEKEIVDYCKRTKALNAKHTKKWNDELNSQWVLRNYMAIKMILSATLMFNSLRFSTEKNVKVTEPYLLYYSLLNSCRALIWSSPNNCELEIEAIQRLTHDKIINLTYDNIRIISKGVCEEIKRVLGIAKVYRELFSYHFPANGLRSVSEEQRISIEQAKIFCRMLCEIAQLNSELLDVSLGKNATGKYNIDLNILKTGFQYEDYDHTFKDNEDWYRLEKMKRKMSRPTNLYFTISDGQIEDFFGAWLQDDEIAPNPNIFNPDEGINVFFSPL